MKAGTPHLIVEPISWSVHLLPWNVSWASATRASTPTDNRSAELTFWGPDKAVTECIPLPRLPMSMVRLASGCLLLVSHEADQP